MSTEELKKAGFRHRYMPAIKKVDETLLGYSDLFKRGNSISIDLRYIEPLKEWSVDNIRITGDEAFIRVKSDLKQLDLESVIEFVKKYPSQTFQTKFNLSFSDKLAKETAYWDTYSGKVADELGFKTIHYIDGVKDSNGFFISVEGVVTK